MLKEKKLDSYLEGHKIYNPARDLYNAIPLSEYLIEECENLGSPLTNITLQYFLYKLQIEFIKKKGHRCFPQYMRAEVFGPVCPEVYYRFCGSGAMPIAVYTKNTEEENAIFKKEPIFQEVINQRKKYWFEYRDWYKYSSSTYSQFWVKRTDEEPKPLISFIKSEELKPYIDSKKGTFNF